MDQIKEKVDFIGIAKRLIEKTKAGETKVLFRIFPIRGVMLDQANLEFFKETLESVARGGISPISLSIIALEDFSIPYSMHDVCAYEGLTQDKININNRSISGNFFVIACSYLHAEKEAVIQMNVIVAILRLSFGSFIVWPKYYEFMTNIAAQGPSIDFRLRKPRVYNPTIDGPFLGKEEDLKCDIQNIIQGVLQNKKREISLALSLIEDAAHEDEERKKVFLYFSAIQVISHTSDLNGLIKVMKKHYRNNSEGWDVLEQYFGRSLLLKPVTILRHNVIHNGRDPQSFPILERYLQILCLEVLEYRLKIPSRNRLEKFIEIYGTSWWLD